MKQSNLYFFLFTILVGLLLYSCANQGTPDGGPRDTIPPTVITSIPKNQSLNFKGSELYFLFDERINADKLKQQLIISPNTDLQYSYVVKKDRLIIKLNSQLEDSTTYTFNFLDGVTDITDKTPAVNLKLAFSTGPYIDSIYVKGEIKELLSGKGAAKYTVGLYDVSDTITIFNGKPKYFSTVTESGTFSIENIKIGKYRIYTWNDENKNLKLETEKEAYGFLSDTLDLSTSKDSINLKTVNINTEKPKLLRATSAGRYFDVKYNKKLLSATTTPGDDQKQLAHQLVNSEKLIRFYNTLDITDTDSIQYYIHVTDSLNQSALDTVQVKFRTTKKKAEDLKVKEKIYNDLTSKELSFALEFTKPIMTINYDSIHIALDTLAYISLNDLKIASEPMKVINNDSISKTANELAMTAADDFTWNTTKTQLNLTLPISWKYINDSVTAVNERYSYLDSVNTDTTRTKYQPIRQDAFKLVLEKGAIISVESDTLAREVLEYKKEDLQELGTFILDIQTEYQDYWLELYNKDNQKTERTVKIKDRNKVSFGKLKPGNYVFIIKVDNNKDGIWSYGNILIEEEPETIIHTGIESALRANFEVNIKLEF